MAGDIIYFCIAGGDATRLQWLYDNYTLREAHEFYAVEAAMHFDPD